MEMLLGGVRCRPCQRAHSSRALVVIIRCQRGSYRPDLSDQPDVDGLRSLAALDHVDSYSLAFRQIGEAATVECRGMHENVLAAAIPDDEPEPFIRVVPLYRTDFLDGSDTVLLPLRSTTLT